LQTPLTGDPHRKPLVSVIGGKADITLTFGMSAYDPKRTL